MGVRLRPGGAPPLFGVAEITGSASRPASSTSAWLSGVCWMPAARFVMSEKPRISMPA